MNCWNIHPILQIWLPLTSVSSQNSKLFLAGQRFSSNQEAIAAVRGEFCISYEEQLQGRDNGAGASLE
jgi:hypothetical protein